MVSVEASSPSQSRRNGGVIQEAAFPLLPRTTLMSPMKKTVRTAVLISTRAVSPQESGDLEQKGSLTQWTRGRVHLRFVFSAERRSAAGETSACQSRREAARLMHTRGSPSQLHPLPPRLRQRNNGRCHYTSSSRELSLLLPSEMLPRSLGAEESHHNNCYRYKCCGCLAFLNIAGTT